MRTSLTGRMDLEAMAKLLPSYDLCVDATHPYAVKVTKQLQAACAAAGVPLRRLLRKESGQEGCMVVDSCAQAASFLQKQRGNVLLTTGAKELGALLRWSLTGCSHGCSHPCQPVGL